MKYWHRWILRNIMLSDKNPTQNSTYCMCIHSYNYIIHIMCYFTINMISKWIEAESWLVVTQSLGKGSVKDNGYCKWEQRFFKGYWKYSKFRWYHCLYNSVNNVKLLNCTLKWVNCMILELYVQKRTVQKEKGRWWHWICWETKDNQCL